MRPVVHFTARRGWINDPHGITFRDGGYHVFYQYVPDRTTWALSCHWGHASGPDLLHLTEQPVAIAPGDGDTGIWTGCIVGTDQDATAFYTAVPAPDPSIGRVRVARPVDASWREWTKGEVVVEAPADLDLVAFRDPFVRREADGWRMFVGASLAGGVASALTWTSDDLAAWEYAGPAVSRSSAETDGAWMGTLWECPQIFELDGETVMVSSVWDDDVLHYAGYAVGTWDDGVFTPRRWGRLTFGESFYAPSLFRDDQGRPCLTFWMRGIGDAEEGWEGAHSVPYLLSVVDGALTAEPHPDVAAHRGPLGGPASEVRAIDAVWSAASDGRLSVADDAGRLLLLERTGATLRVVTGSETTELPVSGDVRVILDGPIVEIASAGGLLGGVVRPAVGAVAVEATEGSVEAFSLS